MTTNSNCRPQHSSSFIMLTGLIKKIIKSNHKENRQTFNVPLIKETPYFVRAWMKGSCGIVSDSCKIISKQFLVFASDSPITARKAAAFIQRLSTSQPHRCLTHSYQLPYNQHKDHGTIIHLSLRNTERSTKHLNLNIVWEMAVVGRWCCVNTNKHSSFRQGTHPARQPPLRVQQGHRQASATCVLFQRNYCLHTTSTDNKPVLPEDVQPWSRSLESQFQIASGHSTHTASRTTLPSSSPGLISIQASRVLFSTELAIKLACGSGGRSYHYFSKQIKKGLKIPSTKNNK